ELKAALRAHADRVLSQTADELEALWTEVVIQGNILAVADKGVPEAAKKLIENGKEMAEIAQSLAASEDEFTGLLGNSLEGAVISWNIPNNVQLLVSNTELLTFAISGNPNQVDQRVRTILASIGKLRSTLDLVKNFSRDDIRIGESTIGGKVRHFLILDSQESEKFSSVKTISLGDAAMLTESADDDSASEVAADMVRSDVLRTMERFRPEITDDELLEEINYHYGRLSNDQSVTPDRYFPYLKDMLNQMAVIANDNGSWEQYEPFESTLRTIIETATREVAQTPVFDYAMLGESDKEFVRDEMKASGFGEDIAELMIQYLQGEIALSVVFDKARSLIPFRDYIPDRIATLAVLAADFEELVSMGLSQTGDQAMLTTEAIKNNVIRTIERFRKERRITDTELIDAMEIFYATLLDPTKLTSSEELVDYLNQKLDTMSTIASLNKTSDQYGPFKTEIQTIIAQASPDRAMLTEDGTEVFPTSLLNTDWETASLELKAALRAHADRVLSQTADELEALWTEVVIQGNILAVADKGVPEAAKKLIENGKEMAEIAQSLAASEDEFTGLLGNSLEGAVISWNIPNNVQLLVSNTELLTFAISGNPNQVDQRVRTILASIGKLRSTLDLVKNFSRDDIRIGESTIGGKVRHFLILDSQESEKFSSVKTISLGDAAMLTESADDDSASEVAADMVRSDVLRTMERFRPEITDDELLEEINYHYGRLSNDQSVTPDRYFPYLKDMLNQMAVIANDNGSWEQYEPFESTLRTIIDTATNVGGIDLNPEYLDLKIKRDGNGIPLPMPQQSIEQLRQQIDGFLPVIINVTPIQNLPMMLGLEVEPDENENRRDVAMQRLYMDKTDKVAKLD
ncbi:MAG: hypothetical protein AB1650_05660, partial [Candidatus Omnitrophota bacterium]